MVRRFNVQKIGGSVAATVIRLDKSGGCVDRDTDFLQRSRQEQIREYFFGDVQNPLSPHTQHIDASQLTIYRIVECKSRLMADARYIADDPSQLLRCCPRFYLEEKRRMRYHRCSRRSPHHHYSRMRYWLLCKLSPMTHRTASAMPVSSVLSTLQKWMRRRIS